MTTIFTDIIEGRKSGHIIYEDEKHIAILDKYPIDTGHSLLITKQPYEKITDMKKDAVSELFSLVPEIANYKGINFIQLIEKIIKDASVNKLSLIHI